MHNRIKAALLLGTLAAGSAMAAVSPDQAAMLGKTLTPVGAEMAGNADGSIPAWNTEPTPSVTLGSPALPTATTAQPDSRLQDKKARAINLVISAPSCPAGAGVWLKYRQPGRATSRCST